MKSAAAVLPPNMGRGHPVAAERDRTSPSRRPALASVSAGEAMTAPADVIDANESMWHAALKLGGSRRQLVVLDRGRLVGVVDQRTLMDHWPCLPFAARDRKLRSVVPGHVHAVMPHVAVSRIAAIMQAEGLDAVPVVDRAGKVLGLVTAADLVRLLAGAETSVV